MRAGAVIRLNTVYVSVCICVWESVHVSVCGCTHACV